MIPILALLSYSQLNSAFDAKPDLSASQSDLPKLDLSMEELGAGKNAEYLDFTDPAGKLKITYGSSWTKTEENILKEAEKISDSKTEKLLLFLYKINLSNLQPSYLAAERTTESNWDNMMDTMRQEAEAKGQTMEIIKSDLENNRVSLEIKYAPKTGKTGTPTHQREEIFLGENESYIVLVLTTEENWPSIKQEAENIIKSIEFLGEPAKPKEPLTGGDDSNAIDTSNTNNSDVGNANAQIKNTEPDTVPAPKPEDQ